MNPRNHTRLGDVLHGRGDQLNGVEHPLHYWPGRGSNSHDLLVEGVEDFMEESV